MPLIQGQVGSQNLNDGATNANLRVGSTGELIVSDFHGLYAEETIRGNAFIYSTTTAASVTALGNNLPSLWNPLGSGKICILTKLVIQAAAIGTPVISGFQYGFLQNAGAQIGTGAAAAPVLTFTAVAAQNLNLMGPQKASRMLWGPAVNTYTTAPALLGAVGLNLGATATQTPWTGMDEINGRIILWPSSVIQLAASTATSTTFNVSFYGIELQIPNINQ